MEIASITSAVWPTLRVALVITFKTDSFLVIIGVKNLVEVIIALRPT